MARGKRGRVAEEGAGDGIEDGGVDEAFVGAEVVVGYGEVGGEGLRWPERGWLRDGETATPLRGGGRWWPDALRRA